jgi:Tripartite tricarboxylate transporter TctB family
LPEMPKANRLTGALIATIALIALVNTWQASLGTVEEPGPGLFPKLLAGLLVLLSVPLMIRNNVSANGDDFRKLLRPALAIFAAVLVFAATIQGVALARIGINVPALGMPVAGTLAMLVSGWAERGTRWPRLAIAAALLPLGFSVFLRFALGQPVALAPWLFGY